MNFIVLSSSRGTVFKAVLERIADGSLTQKCLGLISDREDRGCVSIARAAKLPVRIVERRKDEDRETYDKKIHAAICVLTNNKEATHYPLPTTNCYLACMGWMFLFSPWFVRTWKNRILNVHPSLLPKYPGAHAHDLVLAAGERESGMTIHLIDEGLDSGTILVQKKCSVQPDDTLETLKIRVQKLECEWYPKVLGMIESGDVKL